MSERTILRSRPHLLFILAACSKWLLAAAILWGVLVVLGARTNLPFLGTLGWLLLALVLLRLVLGVLDWLARDHTLTESRIGAQFGVLRTVRTDLPLRRVQHLVLVRSLPERLFGLGSIGVASSGTGSIDVVWRGVARPKQVLAAIREHAQRALDERSTPSQPAVPVIGLVGGVGSGKSTVAKAFAEHGCLVSDSDQAVREVLTQPAVIDRLVSWWGEGVLDGDGRINRSAIADIVFNNPDERVRLEQLVHPMLAESRRDLIVRAQHTGATGVVIDAPLLFEAGVDAECDAVVFVDTPLAVRRQRVQDARGWDAEELDRRERAQLPVEKKREKADWVIPNAGTPGDLAPRVGAVLDKIRADLDDRGLGD